MSDQGIIKVMLKKKHEIKPVSARILEYYAKGDKDHIIIHIHIS